MATAAATAAVIDGKIKMEDKSVVEKGRPLAGLPVTVSMLPTALLTWLKTCPDPTTFTAALRDYAWRHNKHKCCNCQGGFLRQTLRHDVTRPTSGADDLLCQSCWTGIADGHKNGTATDPLYRVPPWPTAIEPEDAAKLKHGILIQKSNGMSIGTVRGYCQRTHSADRVSLFAFPGCEETGSLDPHHVVKPLPNAQ